MIDIEDGYRLGHFSYPEVLEMFWPLLSDPDRKVMTKYGAYGEKMMYGKKTMGVIRSTVWVGPTGSICQTLTPQSARKFTK